MKQNLAIFTAALLLTILFCSQDSLTGNGGSSETVNAKIIVSDTLVTVAFGNDTSEPVALYAFAPDYRPYEKTGYCDSVKGYGGTARLAVPSRGTYNLLVAAGSKKHSCYLPSVNFTKDAPDTLEGVLVTAESISGELLASDASVKQEPYVISIFGSPFYAVSDETSHFTLDSLPKNTYTLSVRARAKRLFLATSNYTITREVFNQSTSIQVILP